MLLHNATGCAEMIKIKQKKGCIHHRYYQWDHCQRLFLLERFYLFFFLKMTDVFGFYCRNLSAPNFKHYKLWRAINIIIYVNLCSQWNGTIITIFEMNGIYPQFYKLHEHNCVLAFMSASFWFKKKKETMKSSFHSIKLRCVCVCVRLCWVFPYWQIYRIDIYLFKDNCFVIDSKCVEILRTLLIEYASTAAMIGSSKNRKQIHNTYR